MPMLDDPASDFYDLDILSWNINGMARKFWDFVGFMRINNFPKIICIQETHSSPDLSIGWSANFGEYFCYYSHGTTASRGTAIFLHRSLDFQILQEIIDTRGRYVILKGFLYGMPVTFGSIYAPSDTAANRNLFFDELIGLNLGDIHYILGDYNSVLDNTLDRPFGSNGGDIELIKFLKDTFSIEAWRIKNQNKIEYSYAKWAIFKD